MEWIDRIIETNIYRAIVFFIVMPINGALFMRGHTVVPIILIAMQVPFFFQSIVKEER